MGISKPEASRELTFFKKKYFYELKDLERSCTKLYISRGPDDFSSFKDGLKNFIANKNLDFYGLLLLKQSIDDSIFSKTSHLTDSKILKSLTHKSLTDLMKNFKDKAEWLKSSDPLNKKVKILIDRSINIINYGDYKIGLKDLTKKRTTNSEREF